MAAARDDLDALFDKLDASLAESRQIFNQIPGGNAVSASSAVFDSNAALTAHSNADMQSEAPQNTSPELQVPAYVHIGSPLVHEDPVASGSSADLQNVNW